MKNSQGTANSPMTKEEFDKIRKTGREMNISVFTMDMPEAIHAFVTQRGCGKYWIFLNSAENETQRTASFIHECLHIYHGDHERDDLTADQIEAIRHAETVEVLQVLRDRESKSNIV